MGGPGVDKTPDRNPGSNLHDLDPRIGISIVLL